MSKAKKSKLRPVVLAVSAGVAISLAGITTASAAESPFKTDKLTSGYQVAGHQGDNGGKNANDGKCGKGKCGGDKAKEGKCGKGKCGGDKGKEGKCGKGKCGS